MGRQVVQRSYLRADGHILAMNSHAGRSADYGRTAGAASLETCEENGVAAVRREGLEVVHHASARGHAAGGDDDHRPMLGIQGARFVRGIDDRCRVAHRITLLGRQSVLVTMPVVDPRRVGGHRAVQVDGQVVNDAALLEQVDAIHQVLGPPDRESRNHHHAAARRRAVDDLAQLDQGIAGLVQAIAVGRFHHQIVGTGNTRRCSQNQIVRAADVAGEKDRPAAVIHTNEGRAQHMAGGGEIGAQS